MPCPTIKAPFESSTFINLKQSIDLKAESSKLPERIIKQPVSSSVHFSAICTRHFTVSGGRPISLQEPPVLILSSFSFSWLSCLSLSQKGGGDRGVSVGSRLPPSLRLSAGESARIPSPQNNSVELCSRRSPRPGPPQPLVGRTSSAPRKRGLAAPARGSRVSSRLRGGNFKPRFRTPPNPPLPSSATGIASLRGGDSSPSLELGLRRRGVPLELEIASPGPGAPFPSPKAPEASRRTGWQSEREG